ncbi:D-aminopeptidase [Brucella pseudogrignonensis]|uniref:D-aminopeptidase n=1 Tax=Brucella pseudogrignonensis TaxID=419475 RepID=UPI00190CEE58|nr:D-aminopeptidase [Brucella pseudogrignonensis]MBK0023614.1 D-aminopeptidase [Ochrobactrum sp. S45]MBK0045591.1 D-aminopeptidase [Ochrobactrum sp. S46]UKK92873.1 D-aminopeptidase [Brucella pseudogrignonensis]
MSKFDTSALEAFVRHIPQNYKGPGGVVAVLKDGEVVLQHAWGFADLRTRKPMTVETRMPICSVSKQFTCGVLLDAVGEPELLDDALEAYLDKFEGERPVVRDLCNNQSGLRDYWALTVLCGADPEGVFLPEQAQSLLRRLKTTHFEPGSHYSYCNGNFRILADLIEAHTERRLVDLLSERIFKPAGMKRAELIPDTALFDECTGYEGDTVRGFLPATNRIHWMGDAGICASLNDMIAWEQFIDATRDEEQGLYRRLSGPQTFNDGAAAPYGFGLKFEEAGGKRLTGHGGALRGWRCQRWHCADERLSTIAMFNFEGGASDVAFKLMNIALGASSSEVSRVEADAAWFGSWLDDETGLVLSLEDAGRGRMKARFGTGPEMMDVVSANEARSSMTTIRRDGDMIELSREDENLCLTMSRIKGEARQDIIGRYHSDELDADLLLVSEGGAIYGAFEGFLGKSDMYPLYSVGADVWLMPVQRSMDAPSPGEWKLVFRRDDKGAITDLSVGCWLARGVEYRRIQP